MNLFTPSAPRNIKREIMTPMLWMIGIAMVGIIIVGFGSYSSSRQSSLSLERTLTVAILAKQADEELFEAQSYVRDILGMSRMVPNQVVRAEFTTRLGRINGTLQQLGRTISDETLKKDLSDFVMAKDLWVHQAMVLLSLKYSRQIPTLETLDHAAQNVSKVATKMVGDSRSVAAATSATVSSNMLRAIVLGGCISALLFFAALPFALKMSHRISEAMQQVSASLRKLADIDSKGETQSANEIGDMFAALDVLTNDVAEKARMSKQLVKEKLRAEEAAQTKSRFLANMSHEIRTPINGILGMAEILNGSKLDMEQRECSGTILKSSEALLSVINDILDFSKNEAGEVTLHPEPFSLYDVVFDVAGLLGPSIGGIKVEVCVNYAEDLPRWFVGDKSRLRQIFMNVVGNAVKFTPKGHVMIHVDHNPRKDIPLSLRIEDTGVGIPEDKIKDIFGAFQQADMQASRQFEGTGLGLAITQQLITQMGGHIDVTSQLGKGSQFTITLPLETCDPQEPQNTDVTLEMGHLIGKTALVVDDMEINRAILTKRLTAWGMKVHSFSHSKAVLEEAVNNPDRFAEYDLGLIDFNMPDLCGDALLEALQEQYGPKLCPMILYSSSDQKGSIPRLKTLGFASVLMKPARAETLAANFLMVLGRNVKDVAERSGASDVPDFSHLTILVAEDNKTNQLVLRKMLQPTNVNLLFHGNGKLAYESYCAAQPDLILMDMSMPVMDGVTATKTIRAHEAAQKLAPCPIVALTANAMQTDKDLCIDAGMTEFLSKPVRKAELLNAIKSQTQQDQSSEEKRKA